MARGEEPRPATEAEVHSWLQGALEQKPPRDLDRQTLRNYMAAKNPRRWRRLQRDYAWLGKMMENLGANPEDGRWIL